MLFADLEGVGGETRFHFLIVLGLVGVGRLLSTLIQLLTLFIFGLILAYKQALLVGLLVEF